VSSTIAARFFGWTIAPLGVAALLALLGGCNSLTGAGNIDIAGSAGQGGAGQGGAASGGHTAAAGSGPDGGSAGSTAPGPCAGVNCDPHGSCVSVGADPACDCATGYHSAGLTCEANPPPGPCDTVTCGANATCVGGTCGCNQGFEGDPTAGCDAIPPTEAGVRAELVQIAQGELGMCEGVDNKPYMLGQPGLWCYDFVAWVYQQSSYSLPAPISLPSYNVGSFPAWWRPEPGDLIKFTIQHYGMVAQVAADGQSITTVEGNVNSCVMSRSVSLAEIQYIGTLDSSF